MKYKRSVALIIYVPPISLFIALCNYSMNILLCSISRTGSCLHKKVNYDTNNNVGLPRGGGGGESEQREDKREQTCGGKYSNMQDALVSRIKMLHCHCQFYLTALYI